MHLIMSDYCILSGSPLELPPNKQFESECLAHTLATVLCTTLAQSMVQREYKERSCGALAPFPGHGRNHCAERLH